MATYSAVLISGTTTTEILDSAGSAVSLNTLTTGDTLLVTSGATVSGITITSGGTEEILSGGSATNDIVTGSGVSGSFGYNGGEIISAGGTASGDMIASGGILQVQETTVGTGANAVTTSGNLESVYVASGGEIVLSGFATDNGKNITGSMTSVGNGAYTLTIYKNTSALWSTTLTGLYSSESVSITGVANEPIIDLNFTTGTSGVVCFLEGTRIQGATVEKAVEELQPGDMVDTLVDGKVVQKPVKWIGSRSVTASQMPEEDAHPVRVRANAFGPGMPQRDLLITPEHCVLVDGKLTPIRMLVNGGSIIVDRTIGAYTFYHVELEQHGILLAEGLAAESYLDTGNRGNFTNTDVPAMRPDLSVDAGNASWESDAAAPLAVDRAFVEPVWQRLAARAEELGFKPDTAPAELVADHDLRLVTDAGWEIRPARHAGDRYSFMVPDGVNTLRLLSQAARPSEVVGPFVDDRRKLGVKVGEIRLLEGRQQIEITSHLGATGLRGWHALEAADGTCRWTNGDAEMPIALGNGPTLVEIQIVAGGPYLPEIADEGIALVG